VELLSTISLLEVSWCFSIACFIVIVTAFVAAPSIYLFELFCQCRLLYVLSIPFNSCHIHKTTDMGMTVRDWECVVGGALNN